MRDPSACRVLLVDDTETNIDILVQTLENDVSLQVAMDGESALEGVADAPPDLILLDIMMPGLDGYEVIRRLKADERFREIPVIFCTAMAEVDDETKGFNLGAVDYITKPFSPPIVRARVRTHLSLKLAQEEQKKQNEILRENIRLREDVERMGRHDLKTPLNAVLNVPKLLISEGNLTQNQVELLEMVEESAYRMLELVNSSLDLYKMETGQYTLRPAPVDLLKMVAQIHGETRDMAQEKNLNLVVRHNGVLAKPGMTFVVAGEEMLCYSMLANLIKNAVEASPPGRSVTINLDNTQGPLVTIHNDGAVPVEIRDRFFEKYATAGKQGGTGIGTYSAKLIADTLGGKIEYETAELTGTMLTIYLPISTALETHAASVPQRSQALAAASEPKAKKEEPRRPALNKSTILIVDDYHGMRKTTSSILKQMGITNIVEAEDGRTAMSLLESGGGVHLVISDWNMPHVTGLDLLKFVRDKPGLRDIPFIMVTGEANRENVIEAAKLQVNEYIIKPYSADILKKKILRHLA
jgi:CheY-like chemotaxis protein